MQGIHQVQVQTIIHAGPLPSPEVLAAYNSVASNAAERILTMAEDQNKHRIALEAIVIPNREHQSRRGQIFAFVIGLAGISASVICAWLKQSVIGSIVGGSTLVGLVGAFLTGKHKQGKELSQKRLE